MHDNDVTFCKIIPQYTHYQLWVNDTLKHQQCQCIVPNHKRLYMNYIISFWDYSEPFPWTKYYSIGTGLIERKQKDHENNKVRKYNCNQWIVIMDGGPEKVGLAFSHFMSHYSSITWIIITNEPFPKSLLIWPFRIGPTYLISLLVSARLLTIHIDNMSTLSKTHWKCGQFLCN